MRRLGRVIVWLEGLRAFAFSICLPAFFCVFLCCVGFGFFCCSAFAAFCCGCSFALLHPPSRLYIVARCIWAPRTHAGDALLYGLRDASVELRGQPELQGRQ